MLQQAPQNLTLNNQTHRKIRNFLSKIMIVSALDFFHLEGNKAEITFNENLSADTLILLSLIAFYL